MPESDELNAEARLEEYVGKVDHKLHLILAATFPNLQRSAGAKQMLESMWTKWPKTFTWLGELNVFKHALAGNGFFSNFTRFLMENPPMTRKQAKEMLEPIVDHLIDQVRARRQTSMFLLTRLLTHPIARPCRSPPAA